MKSKAVVFACLLLFVSVAVIVSAVSEGNQEHHEKVEAAKKIPVVESKQRCPHGRCCQYYRCLKCCGSVAEAQVNTNNSSNNAQQEREVEEATPHRWGGHGGGRRGGGHD